MQDKLLSVINKHAPMKVLANKEAQLKCKPCIYKKILKLIKENIKPIKNILKIKIFTKDSSIIDIRI